MHLLLIRHARPERIDPGDAGHGDPGLSDLGRAQARAMVDALQDQQDLAAVYTSTARRALETAEPLADRLGLPLREDADLVEYGFEQATSYVPAEDVQFQQHPEVDLWTPMASALDPDGPEEAFRRRVVAATDRIAAEHTSQTVAVVCHGGVINAYVTAALGIDRGLIFLPAYTSVSEMRVTTSGQTWVVSLNVATHLDAVQVRAED